MQAAAAAFPTTGTATATTLTGGAVSPSAINGDLTLSPPVGEGKDYTECTAITVPVPVPISLPWSYFHMRFAIAMHLQRHIDAVQWLIQLLAVAILHGEEQAVPISAKHSSVRQAIVDCCEVLTSADLYSYTLPRLPALSAASTSTAGSDEVVAALINSFCNSVRSSFGRYCVTKQRHLEAATAFLSVSPPMPIEAIEAARQAGDWQLALTIAGRFHNSSLIATEVVVSTDESMRVVSSSRMFDLDPRRIANEIVNGYYETIEQAESGMFGDELESEAEAIQGPGASFGVAGVGRSPHSRRRTGLGSGDLAVEAAQLSVDYCQDVERAVALLLAARRWTAAAQVVLKAGRRDLLENEVRYRILFYSTVLYDV